MLKVTSWIGTAAQEIHLTKKRWHITSNRKFSKLLHMSTHTLAKLNPKRPDGSLQLRCIAMIFSRLRKLIPTHFGNDAEQEEHRQLTASLWRIMNAADPQSEAVDSYVYDVTGKKTDS